MKQQRQVEGAQTVRDKKKLTAIVALIFFSLLLWKKARKNTQKARIFSLLRTPKIPGKEGKNDQKSKEFLAQEKSKEIQKSKEKKIRVGARFQIAAFPRFRNRSVFGTLITLVNAPFSLTLLELMHHIQASYFKLETAY